MSRHRTSTGPHPARTAKARPLERGSASWKLPRKQKKAFIARYGRAAYREVVAVKQFSAYVDSTIDLGSGLARLGQELMDAGHSFPSSSVIVADHTFTT